jgi:hypothetical protein
VITFNWGSLYPRPLWWSLSSSHRPYAFLLIYEDRCNRTRRVNHRSRCTIDAVRRRRFMLNSAHAPREDRDESGDHGRQARDSWHAYPR